MQPKLARILLISFTTTVFTPVQFGVCFAQTKASLPSLNLWDIQRAIVQESKLADELSITPEQRNKLRALKLEGDSHGRFEDTRAQSLKALDPQVLLMLANVLTDEQLEELRPTMLRFRYRNAVEPFVDHEVAIICKFSREDRAKIIQNSKDALSELYRLESDTRRQVAVEVLRSLPIESQQKLVHLVGNEFSPKLLIEENPLLQLPVFPELGGAYFARSIVQNKDLQDELGVTSKQLKEFERVARQSQEFSDGMRKLDMQDIPSLFRAQRAKERQEILRIATPEQHASLSRRTLFSRTCREPLWLIEDKSVRDYLGITDSEATAFRAEYNRIVEEQSNARFLPENQRVFNQFRANLSAEAQKRLTDIFGEVWPLDSFEYSSTIAAMRDTQLFPDF